jgi:regulator of sigma E protease
MEILIQVAQFLLSLSLIVILHEFGHYIPAKLFGTRVEKFYLFFDYKWSLIKKKIGETEWGVGWIPLGGYVKIAGMVDESMDLEQLDQPVQPWEFRAKPAWQRLIIMVGGVTVNLILGFFIYAMMLWAYGDRILPTDSLENGVWVVSPLAEQIGFENGDIIQSVRGEEVYNFSSLTEEMVYGGMVQIERNGRTMDIVIPDTVAGALSSSKNRGAFFYPRIPFIISKVAKGSENHGILEKRDRVQSIAGVDIIFYDQAKAILKEHAGEQTMVVVDRDGRREELKVSVNEEGLLGISAHIMTMDELEKAGHYSFDTKSYSFLESIPAGWNKTMDRLSGYVRQFSLILNPDTGAYKGLGGFVSIGGLFPPEWDWQSFWNITALLSIILAFMNLLPIPVLDGGHVVFLLYEMVTGRQPNQRILEYAQMIGFFLLIALLLYANGNDIYRLLFD